MKFYQIFSVFLLLLAGAVAETENFTSSATMNTTSPFCNVTAPVNGSYENGGFTVDFKGTDYVALSWIALFERNDTTGSFGAWQMLWNQTGPANNTGYPVLKTNITGNYTLQYYCNLTSASLSSAVSTTNTVYVDAILPTLNWTMPSTNNSSFASYGEGWFVNASARDFTLSVCNISVYDSVGNLSYNASRVPVAGVCHFTDIISTLNHPTGSWTFRIYVADAAGNNITEARTAWLYTQNTSHTIWSRSDDPLRTREWIISKGMTQNITEHYHTNLTANVSGNYSVYGYFGPMFGSNTNFTFTTAGMGMDWLNDTYYAIIYTMSPGLGLYPYFQIYDFNGHLLSNVLMPLLGSSTFVQGLECSYIDQRDDFCFYLQFDALPPGNEQTQVALYHLNNQTSTLLWSHHRSEMPLYMLGSGFARVGNYFYISSKYTNDLAVFDFYGNLIAIYPNSLTDVNSMLYSDGTYIFAVAKGAFVYCSPIDVYDVAMNKLSTFYPCDMETPVAVSQAMMVKGSSFYMAKYTNPWQNSSYFQLGNSIANADCRFTSSQHNITNAPMTELSPGYYNYNYTESVTDGTPVYYDATCSAPGFETSTDPGVYYTGNWHQPSGYSGLAQYLGAPTYFDGTHGDSNTTCSLLTLKNNDVSAVDTIELFAYYNNNSSLPFTAKLALWNESGGQPDALLMTCDVSVTTAGWVNCTATSGLFSLHTNSTFFACVNNSDGLATKIGGHGFVNGSWFQTDEVAVTLQAPWNVDQTQPPPLGSGEFTNRKFIIVTTNTLYTTDFVNKQLEWFGAVNTGWTITHVSTDDSNNVIIRMVAANNTCRAARYSFFGQVTAENVVDCAATSAGIHSVRGAYWSFGYNGLFRSDTLSGFTQANSFGGTASWTDGFNCTRSEIEYDVSGDGYIVCINDRLDFDAPIGGSVKTSAIAWAHVNKYQSVSVELPTQSLYSLIASHTYLLNWAKTAMFSNTVDKRFTIMYADPIPLQDTFVKYLDANGVWVGGQMLSGQKWTYGILGYGGNWVFSYVDGSNSKLVEYSRSSGTTREIKNTYLQNVVGFAKFAPSVFNFKTDKNYIDLKLTNGQLCSSCNAQGLNLHIDDVIVGLNVRQVFDTDTSTWKTGAVPGMTVGVYVDDVYRYTFDMTYDTVKMVETAQHSIQVNGSKVTLKFYSYGVLEDTQDYYVQKAQIVLPPMSEIKQYTDTDFFPNPWYYNNKIYILPYLNTYNWGNSTFGFNFSAADPTLSCQAYVNYETGGVTPLGAPSIEKLGPYYVFSFPKPFALSTPGQNVTLGIQCTGGSKYEMNYSEVNWQYTNETFGFKVNNWLASGNDGTFRYYYAWGANSNISFDVCVRQHPLLNYLSSAPDKFYVNPNVGDPTGWTYPVNWTELGRYTYGSQGSCFSSIAALNILPNIQAVHDYFGRYMLQFASHNASVIPRILYQGSDVLPSSCNVYDIQLTSAGKRESTFTASYTCRGGASTFVWDYLLDGSIKYKALTNLWLPSMLNEPGTIKYTFYVYPDTESQYYTGVDCSDCAKFTKPIGSTMAIDLTAAFGDKNGNVFEGSQFSKSFQITVGDTDNTEGEPGTFFGGDLLSGITAFAVKNPLSFLLAVVLVVVVAPLALVLIR